MAQVVSDTQRILGQVTAMAMLDEEFRARLEVSPLAVLQEFGMDLPDTAQIAVVTDPTALADARAEETVVLFVPQAVDLAEEDLALVNGAMASCQSTQSTLCSAFCISCLSTSSTNSSQ